MPPVTDLTARRLEALLAAEQRTRRLPSVLAALTRDGALVWRGSRGVAAERPAGPGRDYWAWLTVDMLKSGTRRAGVAVRGK